MTQTKMINDNINIYGDIPESLGTGHFCLNNLLTTKDSKSVEKKPLSVGEYKNSFLIKTMNGYRVFDENLAPVESSFSLRGGIGSDLKSIVRKGQEFAFIIADGSLKKISWDELPGYKDSFEHESIENLLYLCPLHNEFGHGLTEGLSRFWPFFNSFNLRFDIAFNGPESERNHELSSFLWAGVEKEIGRKVERLTRLRKGVSYRADRIYIPEPALNLAGTYNQNIETVWGKLSNIEFEFSNKVYFSRRFVRKRECKDEERIESIFREFGYDIVHPEKLSLNEQVSLVGRCSVIAGLSGSALHLSQFLREGATIIALTPSSHAMADLISVARVKGLQLYYLISDQTKNLSNDGDFRFIDSELTKLKLLEILMKVKLDEGI